GREGKFDLTYYEQDIYRGPTNILSFVERGAASVCQVRYEDLVTDPQSHTRRITDFLELPPLPSVKLPERDRLIEAKLGDKTGIHKFQSVSTASAEEWRKTFASPIRKHWARAYLDFI